VIKVQFKASNRKSSVSNDLKKEKDQHNRQYASQAGALKKVGSNASLTNSLQKVGGGNSAKNMNFNYNQSRQKIGTALEKGGQFKSQPLQKANNSKSQWDKSFNEAVRQYESDLDFKQQNGNKVSQLSQAIGAIGSAASQNMGAANGNKGYQPSQSVVDAQNKKTQAEDAVANYGDFKYKNQDALQSAMDAITNREAFSYDLNSDALYQQYKDNYMAQGKQAMMDSMGQAAALTGGYGSSYASVVGNQAYQGQLQNLNNVVPELYGLALDTYQAEGQRLKDNYGILSDDRNTEYGMYQDKYNRLTGDRDYYSDNYNNAYSQDYGQYRDSVADDQWNKTFNEGVRQYNEDRAYQKDRDAVLDARDQRDHEYQKSIDERNYKYQVGRDQVLDARDQRDYEEAVRQHNESVAYQRSKSSSGGSGGGSNGGNNQSVDTDSGYKANSTQVSKFRSSLASGKEFKENAQPITRGNRGNTGNGGFRYNGTIYRDYNDYIYKELERSYSYGLIDEGTLSYLLDEYNF
jgi:hypothetical protein